MRYGLLMTMVLLLSLLCGPLAPAQAQDTEGGRTYRLYEGITAYVHNPEGKAFSVHLEIRDLNLFEHGPREVLFKVYDPDGQPVVREVIPDDGITEPAFADRVAGWADELQYYSNLYAKGTNPSFRWSTWSTPQRLAAVPARSFDRPIEGGKKGVYRIVLAGTNDHYATLKIAPDLAYGVAGHPNWMHGSGDLHRKSYIYVPQDTAGIFFAIAEPDRPQTRTFKLTAPDGTILFEGPATGGYVRLGGQAWQESPLQIEDPEAYHGKLLTLEVSEGRGDYLVKVLLQQPKEGAFAEYLGMGTHAIYCDDPETAMALRGGTFVEDGLVFWHPFQARFHRWLKDNPLDGDDEQKALRGQLEAVFNSFRQLETSDGPGGRMWSNWSYAFGYYGLRYVWKRTWILMNNPAVPEEVKAIIREGLIMGGDRLSFVSGTERVNGNAFAQVPVSLWYCHRATGDPLQKERFELFWDRWANEGWGPGIGRSRSGDAQEFFAHDAHYGSYIMDNWKASGNTWVKEGGILGDATDDHRFQEVMDRYYELYSYIYCREQNKRPVPANPWSARTHQHAHNQELNWETLGGAKWKGEPGPDFTVSVNGGDEWFAARRAGYYMVTFHGRLAPEWLSRSFPGQLGFSGGILAQLTVPGKGPVLASTLTQSYGTGMDPSNWRNFHLHGLMGELWDSRPLIAAISEHHDARLEGNTVTSSGEVRNGHVQVARSYTYGPEAIECAVQLAPSDFQDIMSVWSFGWERNWSEVKSAYEVFPYMPNDPSGKNPTLVTLLSAVGEAIGEATTTPTEAQAIRIDRGGFGVEIRLEQPAPVLLGANHTVMVQIVAEGEKPTPADQVGLKYTLVPFGN